METNILQKLGYGTDILHRVQAEMADVGGVGKGVASDVYPFLLPQTDDLNKKKYKHTHAFNWSYWTVR